VRTHPMGQYSSQCSRCGFLTGWDLLGARDSRWAPEIKVRRIANILRPASWPKFVNAAPLNRKPFSRPWEPVLQRTGSGGPESWVSDRAKACSHWTWHDCHLAFCHLFHGIRVHKASDIWPFMFNMGVAMVTRHF
jgi:hypothetical protein